MRTASVLIKELPAYRHYCFVSGLKANGYRVTKYPLTNPEPSDVLVLWNRHGSNEHYIRVYERAGATVLISENGYIGPTRALAKSHHNGAGEWYVGEEDRWSKLGIETTPWREDGDFILVLPQRGMGEPGVAMPRNWLPAMVNNLRAMTDRPIRVRKHPGQNDTVPLINDLHGAWAAVTWGSGAGIKAIVHGIPVFYNMNKWIGALAARSEFDIENPYLGDRTEMLRRMAWAQWTSEELESGEAFRWLV